MERSNELNKQKDESDKKLKEIADAKVISDNEMEKIEQELEVLTVKLCN